MDSICTDCTAGLTDADIRLVVELYNGQIDVTALPIGEDKNYFLCRLKSCVQLVRY